jgi:DNA polymerase-3 subunit delta
VDKRRKVITAIVKAGRIVEFPIPRTEEKNAWLKAYLAKQGKMADNAVINQLTFVAGQNLALLKQEADKICLYTGGRQKIEQADIEAVVSKNSISSIFSLLDAVAEQKATLALNLYREMLRQGEAPQMILAMLSGQFHNILAVQDLRREEHKPGDIAKILGLHPFAVEKCLRFANRYSVPKGIKSLEILLAADIAQKTGTGDMTELLETAILRICSF